MNCNVAQQRVMLYVKKSQEKIIWYGALVRRGCVTTSPEIVDVIIIHIWTCLPKKILIDASPEKSLKA